MLGKAPPSGSVPLLSASVVRSPTYEPHKGVAVKELRAKSEVELLQAHSAVIDELRRRKVVKTENNPLGDYTEWGFAPVSHSELLFVT